MELTFENLYLAGVEASPKEKINFAARPRLGPLACASGLLRAAGEHLLNGVAQVLEGLLKLKHCIPPTLKCSVGSV